MPLTKAALIERASKIYQLRAAEAPGAGVGDQSNVKRAMVARVQEAPQGQERIAELEIADLPTHIWNVDERGITLNEKANCT